jgi:hypothetical protein
MVDHSAGMIRLKDAEVNVSGVQWLILVGAQVKAGKVHIPLVLSSCLDETSADIPTC